MKPVAWLAKNQELLNKLKKYNQNLITRSYEHSISLSVKYVTKQSKMLEKTVSPSEEIVVLIKHSTKQENILGCI